MCGSLPHLALPETRTDGRRGSAGSAAACPSAWHRGEREVPSDPYAVRLTFHLPGDAVLQAAAPPLLAFLTRADRVVPMGQELAAGALDAQLPDILSGGCENAG